MLKTVLSTVAIFAIVCSTAWTQVPVTGKKGATIDSLIKEKTLVTIVLKGGIEDVNLKITAINDSLINFTASNGSKNRYLLSQVKEIKVQKQKQHEAGSIINKVVLTNNEQQIVKEANARANEIFNQLNSALNLPKSAFTTAQSRNQRAAIQELRLRAALVLAVSGNNDGLMYIKTMVGSSSIDTSISAALYLLQAGEKVPDYLLKDAFMNGERISRSNAAIITGMTGKKQFIKDLRKMSLDPSDEIYPFAVRALGLLGDKESIPQMYKGLYARSEIKAEAAIFALSKLGGDDVIEGLNSRLSIAKNIEKFRILRLLYILGDENAANMMRDIGLSNASYNKAVALVLTEHSDWDGVNWLREYLNNKATDPNMVNLFYRAYAAKSLYESAPNESIKILRELTNITPTEIYARDHTDDVIYKTTTAMLVHVNACHIIGSIADKSMLTLLSALTKDESPIIALAACDAIAKIANAEYLEISNEFNEVSGLRESTLKDFFK